MSTVAGVELPFILRFCYSPSRNIPRRFLRNQRSNYASLSTKGLGPWDKMITGEIMETISPRA
jgi:hypothetical protein